MTTATTSGLDPRVLARVRAMLAKAESTPYPQEALAFNAKAQELIAAHSIDLAMLERRHGDQRVSSVRMVVPSPYASGKTRLLSGVAQPNRCRLVIGLTDDALDDLDFMQSFNRSDDVCTVFGHPADLEVVQLLFTSLLAQATNAMLANGPVRDAWGANRTRSFRHSFLIGFAAEVHDRLAAAAESATQIADEAAGGQVLPVLANRIGEVDAAVDDAFPDLGVRRLSYSNTGGFAAGAQAGRTADVGTSQFGRTPTALD